MQTSILRSLVRQMIHHSYSLEVSGVLEWPKDVKKNFKYASAHVDFADDSERSDIIQV